MSQITAPSKNTNINSKTQEQNEKDIEKNEKFRRTSMRLQEQTFWLMKELAAAKKMNLTELCHESFQDTLVKNKRLTQH